MNQAESRIQYLTKQYRELESTHKLLNLLVEEFYNNFEKTH